MGGRLNASYNCIDRHLATQANKAAFIWVPEPEAEETRTITYRELYNRVNGLAAMLSGFCGLRSGDRVTFHMPMVPDLPVSMLACARLGIVHSEVFGGFSGAACGGRIADSGSRVLVTIDGYYRDGKWIDHKTKADEAVAVAKQEGVEIEKVLEMCIRDRVEGPPSSLRATTGAYSPGCTPLAPAAAQITHVPLTAKWPTSAWKP